MPMQEAANAALLNFLFNLRLPFHTNSALVPSVANVGVMVDAKYTATADRGKPTAKKCTSERNFCSECSSMLWLWDKTWPELIHPFASAIDTELPIAEEMVCVKGDSKPEYVRWPEGKKKVYEGYGEFSIEEWHKEKGFWVA
ncbi:hypothetical protein BOTNAR_0112g00040 [Botryotinia narcissicola]|uniref:CENP-V/GFA domain-containing protein n=1 Tax=Botryotinia narcissicola TaxID=278944 RepID=A0A4Z1IM93_9HELO|nr:hypothetical protein BOTNAR_0112g00040 [Botryotinia narcissicola]